MAPIWMATMPLSWCHDFHPMAFLVTTTLMLLFCSFFTLFYLLFRPSPLQYSSTWTLKTNLLLQWLVNVMWSFTILDLKDQIKLHRALVLCCIGLVNISKGFLLPYILTRINTLSSRNSLMKWHQTSICLVLAWYAVLLAKCVAL